MLDRTRQPSFSMARVLWKRRMDGLVINRPILIVEDGRRAFPIACAHGAGRQGRRAMRRAMRRRASVAGRRSDRRGRLLAGSTTCAADRSAAGVRQAGEAAYFLGAFPQLDSTGMEQRSDLSEAAELSGPVSRNSSASTSMPVMSASRATNALCS